eukprot:3070229-Rhodomonas_salina.1
MLLRGSTPTAPSTAPPACHHGLCHLLRYLHTALAIMVCMRVVVGRDECRAGPSKGVDLVRGSSP